MDGKGFILGLVVTGAFVFLLAFAAGRVASMFIG